MAWVKLDDAMSHHPKVIAAGPQGFALDVAGICYSNRYGTDGFIASYALAAVCPSLPNPKRWARIMVEAGRWVEVDGGWRIQGAGEWWIRFVGDQRLSRHVRQFVLQRDGRACRNCGDDSDPQVDHVIPRAKGGSDDPSNLQVLCGPCNRRKGVLDPEEWD